MILMHIDPHVHCRDWNQSYKATIKSVTELARSQGVVAFIDMPNTDPPITTEELVNRRLETARSEGCLDGYYLYIGATTDPDQIREAVRIFDSNLKVAGIKMYAGKSVGDLAVTNLEDQRVVYKTLSEVGYKGPLAVHCEKESLFRPNLWDMTKPYTWGAARPREAEIESVKEQIALAREYGFKGKMHVCHISVPESVMLVDSARKDLQISCGATPHHLTLSSEDMLTVEHLEYKVNPPIRSHADMRAMRRLLKEGKIDVIETDHAPHSPEEKSYNANKANDSYMSGIPSLKNYKAFLDGLKKDGFTNEQIDRITYSNVKGIFMKIRE